MRATWKPHEKHGDLTERGDLPQSVYAFPKERKEPLTDESHVRNAIARFNQVTGVSDDERAQAFANIKKAAKYYGVDLSEAGWKDLDKKPSGRSAPARKKSARKASATRKRKGTGKKKTPARKRGAKRAAATRKKAPGRKKTSAAKKTPGRKKTGRRKKTRAH